MDTPQLIKALEIERDGDWDKAHRIVQRLGSRAASRVHAYLHRREGDLGNAGYWYSRAGEPMPQYGLDEEWQALYERLKGSTE